MARLWRAWQDREVRIIGGRFDGARGRVLGTSRNRMVVVGITRGQPEGGRCIKIRKSMLEPISPSSPTTQDVGRKPAVPARSAQRIQTEPAPPGATASASVDRSVGAGCGATGA